MLSLGFRYYSNLYARIADQRGYPVAVLSGSRLLFRDIGKIPRWISWYYVNKKYRNEKNPGHPVTFSPTFIENLTNLPVHFNPYFVDLDSFNQHVLSVGYPFNYAAGPMQAGGAREQKLLEYFVSLDLLDIQSSDIVLDVASEWSLFPEVVRKLIGSRVYRQDLVYPQGVRGDHIGGKASCMPVSDNFANKIVLHNAFEHFEGSEDTDFIREAWRVLKPGGKLCILPLFVSDKLYNLTDPLVNRHNVVWDQGATVVEIPWWHNRFGRFYNIEALKERVLEPGDQFQTTIYQVVNVEDIHPKAYLHFILLMQKPLER